MIHKCKIKKEYEAVCFDSFDKFDIIVNWLKKDFSVKLESNNLHIFLRRSKYNQLVNIGDWIVYDGVNFSVYKDDNFMSIFEVML
jgi:hypothetical protein